jgi:urease accessory protein
MRSGAVGKTGLLHLEFEKRGDRSILSRLRKRTPYFAHKALYFDRGMPNLPCVFLITTTGCVLQGDRLHLEVKLGPDASAHLTTQSGTQIHTMNANYAAQSQTVTMSENSYLEFLPEPMFPHSDSRFLTDTIIKTAPGSTVLYSEILMSGRKHYGSGERFLFKLFSSKIRVEDHRGVELVTEKYIVEPEYDDLRRVGKMGEFDVFGNVYLLTPPEHAESILESLDAGFDLQAGLAWGTSALPNQAGLLFKVLGHESGPVTNKIREFWTIVRRTVKDRPIPDPYLWR